MSRKGHELEPAFGGLPHAVVVHHIPGRCRLAVPSMRGDASYFDCASGRLSSVRSLKSVRTTCKAASIVIEYTGSFEQISWLGRRHGLFRVSDLPPPQSTLPQPLPRDWQVRGPYSDSAIENLRNTVTAARLQRPWLALTLGGLGTYQLWRADPLSTALNILFMLLKDAIPLPSLGAAVVSR